MTPDRAAEARTLLTVLVLLAIPLAGCIGGLPDSMPKDDGAETGPRTIEHALGTTTISGTVDRVVAIEWPYVEALLAIGVQPVGVADVQGYTKLVKTTPGLGPAVTDVGTRQEPNLERIASLRPDLIVGVKFRHEAIHDDLAKIAPTLVFDPWPENGSQLERMEETVAAIAEAVGRPDAGTRALDAFHEKIQEGKERIASAGLGGQRFVLSQVLAPEYGEFRLFQDHHAAVRIIERLGLKNAWQDETELNGFSTVGLEAMARVQDAHMLYVPSSGTDLERFAGNPAWDGLAFVKEDRTFDLSGAWLLPGPLSGQAFVERIMDALVPGTGPRVIAHAAGETTIEGTPRQVVALEFTYVEDLLALGVQPAGVADVEGYEKWVDVHVPLAATVTDVGTRQEPSLEAIAALGPDLIIGATFRHEPILEDLQAIAPTLLFDPYPAAGLTQHDEMEQTFTAIARAVGRPEEGRRVLADLQDHYAAAKAVLSEEATMHGFLLVQAFTWQDAPTMRVFTQNAMASEVLGHLGLTNAWDDGHQAYGFSTVGLEALEPVQHADFLYVAQADDDPFEEEWKDDPAWRGLRFVQEERVHPLGGDTWLFGGPLSAMLLVDQVVETYGVA